MATLTRIFEFDSAHRVMNEKVKCFNLHGHRFKVELTFEFEEKGSLGYAIDFKEIKRIAGTWLDDMFDHACILNPLDSSLITLCRDNGWRLYVMGMGNHDDINPSAENIAYEILYALRFIFNQSFAGIVELKNVRLYETPNCWVDIQDYRCSEYFAKAKVLDSWREFADKMGVKNYDIRE